MSSVRDAFPLIAWGDPDNISAYTSGNTPTITSGVADPFGGTSAYTIDDTDVASSQYKIKSYAPAAGARPTLCVFAKAGTATATEFGIFDTTAGLQLVTVRLDWSGGVPTASETSVSDAVALTPVAVGGGWYCCLGYSNVLYSSGHTCYLRLFGGLQTVTGFGSTSYYVRNAVLLDRFGAPRAYRRPRAGYQADVAPSGAEDAWTYGDEYVLKARLAWAPSSPRAAPVIVSGWYGQNESAGVNCGVLAMLNAGWEKNALTLAPDRSAASTNYTAYLRQPTVGWEPGLEASADYMADLELVGSSPFLGY